MPNRITEREDLHKLDERDRWRVLVEEHMWPLISDMQDKVRALWDEIWFDLEDADQEVPTTHARLIHYQDRIRETRIEISEEILVISGWLQDETMRILMRELAHEGTKFACLTSDHLKKVMLKQPDPIDSSFILPSYEEVLAGFTISEATFIDAFDQVRLSDREKGTVYDDPSEHPYSLLNVFDRLQQLGSDDCRVSVIVDYDLYGTVLPFGSHMERWIREFVENGIYFAKQNGKVVYIHAIPTLSHIEIEILDTGTGINEATKQALLANQTVASSKETGTGSGFVLSKQLIESKGGSVGIETEPGFTKVIIKIPLDPNEEPAGW